MTTSAQDIRVGAWSVRATAGTSPEFVMTWTDEDGADFDLTGMEVSLWVGGTVWPDPTDLDDADEFTTTIATNTATGSLDVPTTGEEPLRVTLDGALVAVGVLIPSTTGTDSPDITVAVNVEPINLAVTFVGGGGGGGGGTGIVETVVAGAGIAVDSTDPANPIVTAEVTQAELDAVSAAIGTAITTLINGAPAGGDTLGELNARLAVIEALGSLATDAELIAAVAAILGTADAAGDTLGELQALIGLRLLKSQNLADVANTATARTNLSVYSIAAVDAIIAGLSGTFAPLAEPIAAAHIADGTDAHAASAITNTPAGGIAATTVQGAVNELDTEKAPLASPALTGNPTAPTQTAGNNSTRLATTAYADAAIAALIGTAPGVLDTLGEISDAINDDANLYTTLQTAIAAKVADAINDGTTGVAPSQNAVFDALALKAPLASPTLTGTPAAPTAAPGTNTTQLATTAFVAAAAALRASIGPSVIQTKTTTYTAADREIVLASAAGGSWALTLPAVAAGAWVTVKKTGAANTVTVTPASGTIDGAATYPISTQYVSRDFVSDGTNWFIL